MTIPTDLSEAKIVIIGAGPTGLGAAYRLHELGFSNFTVFERESHVGGLSASFVDPRGFTWDIGGHVLFSHYGYFDRCMDSVLGDEWVYHAREAWIWMKERFIPYPFQNNIRYLPPEEMKECLRGLFACAANHSVTAPANFEEFVHRKFGEGIARHFMAPYNFKVWAYPLSELSHSWIGERVAVVDLERIVFNIIEGREDVSWGPNSQFRFPARGGTGEIWRRVARCLPPERLVLGKSLERLEARSSTITFSDGSTENYDVLISTAPLDRLIQVSDLDELKPAVARLRRSSTNVVGFGLKGCPVPKFATKCWIYFPEFTTPFYRATVFSNYSPNNVPDHGKFWSLMLEVSESVAKPVDQDQLVDQCVAGLLSTGLIENLNDIVSTWCYRAEYGYPTPSLSRDDVLSVVLPALERRRIFSRGRFGTWKYEVGNQDHCMMQGVEIVDRLVSGVQETIFQIPELVRH